MALGKKWLVGLPEWHERLLIKWAYAKGVSKTALSQNTLQARVEANQEQIETMFAELAKFKGKSVEELESELFNGSESDSDD